MNLRQFQHILQQVLLLPILALGITAGALYLQILNANRTVDLIRRSDMRISQTMLASKLIVDEETGLRGFEVTGDERFLEPYYSAAKELDPVFDWLDNSQGQVSRDGVPFRGIVKLREAHRTWQVGFAEPLIATVRAGGNMRDPTLNLHGKQLMDDVREETAGIIRRSEARRASRIADWQRQVRWTEFALFAMAAGAGLLIGLFTRNRMHQVSDAFQRSLEDVGRRADQIYESEQKLRTTLTSIGDGVITTDAEGQVEMMNTVAEELTGWTQDQARGQSISDVFHIVNEDSREPVEDPVAKVRRMNRIVGLANHTVLLGRNGTELQIADSGAPIRDKRGRISGVVMVFRDVTMERRTQEALLAQEKLAVAGRLAATIAHEINNPLGSVTDMLYLMRTGVSEREQQQYLDMADGELRRMGEIVRAMLGLYRESHAPIQVDLGATMREILLLTERRFVELGVKLLPDLPAHICVMGFPAELRQVFTNLVTNALEAVGRGGEVRVTVAWETADDGQRPRRGATVTIEDNGPGIPQDVLPQLFQPFFTTKGERGTGLGLWVSRGIISKHSGTLDLRSSIDPENHGTLARVFLPVDSPSLAKSASQI